jgi:hypothetical protein
MTFWRAPEPDPPQSSSTFTTVVGLGLIAFLVVVVATAGVRAYGWTLFVGTPFFLGYFHSRLIADDGSGLWRAMGWALVSITVCGSLLLLLGLEGLICLLMLVPLAAPVVIAGVLAGFVVRYLHVASRGRRPGAIAGVFLLLTPGGLAVDAHRTASAPLHAVVTSIEIDAPPERVWPHVVSFTELPPPTEWIFASGVAWPMRARIEGTGAGAVRYCEFSTGAFVEPITVWDAPRRLAFTVAKSPAPMTELNPFVEVRPPHLDGYLASERGEFRLEPLPGGRTRLIGTTWYRHHMFPDRYWQTWTDFIIHRIHRRVLRHIEALAEAQERRSSEAQTKLPGVSALLRS